jgi:hypothetical protein
MPLGKRPDCGDAKYAGVEIPFACDIVATLEVMHAPWPDVVRMISTLTQLWVA